VSRSSAPASVPVDDWIHALRRYRLLPGRMHCERIRRHRRRHLPPAGAAYVADGSSSSGRGLRGRRIWAVGLRLARSRRRWRGRRVCVWIVPMFVGRPSTNPSASWACRPARSPTRWNEAAGSTVVDWEGETYSLGALATSPAVYRMLPTRLALACSRRASTDVQNVESGARRVYAQVVVERPCSPLGRPERARLSWHPRRSAKLSFLPS